MKKILFAFILVAFSVRGMAQTAVNFNANDCSGVNHDLFTELDAGKIIVLCWVMPCGACVGPSITTYNIVQSYATSHPNKVFFYLIDDYANTNCTSLASWATSNNLTNSTKFSNSAINMMDYGSTGMPKIVVVGGTNHQVFYNANNSVNATALQNAINSAIGTSGIIDPVAQSSTVNVFPNPAGESSVITAILTGNELVTIELMTLEGKILEGIYTGELTKGEHIFNLDLAKYSNGIYLIKWTIGGKTETTKLNVVH